jgi:hypothetical protein
MPLRGECCTKVYFRAAKIGSGFGSMKLLVVPDRFRTANVGNRKPGFCKAYAFSSANEQEKVQTQNSRFDSLVARYYPAVYSFASKLTDDPREAVALTREAFNGARKQLQSILNQTVIATILIAAVPCAGLASA